MYGPGAHANALYTMLSRDKGESHLFLPLTSYETDADRARAGAPANDQEQLDRAVAGLIREIETDTEERMILTELPPDSIPAHVRDIAADLTTPRAPGTGQSASEDQDHDAPEVGNRSHYGLSSQPADTPGEPFPFTATSPYAHLDANGLRTALRRATTASQATRAAAEEAEARATRAEQQAAAGTGPNVLALHRRLQDVAERAGAVRELRDVEQSLAQSSEAQQEVRGELHHLEEQLAAVGRFGRPVLRGSERDQGTAECDQLRQRLEEAAGEVDRLEQRSRELAAVAGPSDEHEAVLTEEVVLTQDRGTLIRRAQRKDSVLAAELRQGASAASSTAQGAAHREVNLRAEADRRAQDDETQPGQGRPTDSRSPYAVHDAMYEVPERQPEPPSAPVP